MVGPNGEEEIAPYATFHLLGFREEMDPSNETPNGAGFQTMAARPPQQGRPQPPPQGPRTLVRPAANTALHGNISAPGQTISYAGE